MSARKGEGGGARRGGSRRWEKEGGRKYGKEYERAAAEDGLSRGTENLGLPKKKITICLVRAEMQPAPLRRVLG